MGIDKQADFPRLLFRCSTIEIERHLESEFTADIAASPFLTHPIVGSFSYPELSLIILKPYVGLSQHGHLITTHSSTEVG